MLPFISGREVALSMDDEELCGSSPATDGR